MKEEVLKIVEEKKMIIKTINERQKN